MADKSTTPSQRATSLLTTIPDRTQQLSRRQFLRFSAMGGSALALAACAGGGDTSAPAPAADTPVPATNTPEPAPTEEPVAAAADGEVEVMVNDVVDYVLESDDWEGDFGSVTMMLHEALYNGESVYHIRTDSGDQPFAEEVGLVFVPLLNTAAALDPSEINSYYVFSDERTPVIEKIPGDENYTSLFQYTEVTVNDDSADLTSAQAVMDAAEEGAVTLEEGSIFVNYPLIKWPGGELSVDTELAATLPNGQLFAEPDMDAMQVTMKLHQCYPGSRYILTDSGMMAPMMSIVDAAITNKLKDVGGTDEIWVFANGIPGPGVMGFQPAIFDNKAGEPAWSPFWDHFTVRWVDEGNARLLTSSAEIRELVDSGELEQFNGVPDSHPTGFVVNCPAPILAPNTFAA